MTVPLGTELSRRGLLRGGVAVAGAGALGASGLLTSPASAEPGVVIGPGGGPAAVPTPYPGTLLKGISAYDFRTSTPLGSPQNDMYMTPVGVLATQGGMVYTRLDLDPGTALVKIDFHGYRTTSGPQQFRLVKVDPTALTATILISANTSGSGPLSISTGTVHWIEPGFEYQVQADVDNDAGARRFKGIEVHYIPSGSLQLTTPTRVYDSRPGNPPLGGTKSKLIGGPAGQRTIDCTVGGAVPLFAGAALVSLTIMNTSAGGFVSLFEDGIAWPGTSSINWDHANQVVAVTTMVSLGSLGKMTAYAAPGSSTDLAIDVLGFMG